MLMFLPVSRKSKHNPKNLSGQKKQRTLKEVKCPFVLLDLMLHNLTEILASEP
ncbi:hypothetical protein LINPERHAP2_LOCUS42195 [Linum perenne]